MLFQGPPPISKPLTWDRDHSCLQQIFMCWTPTSAADAKRVAEECFERAGGLAWVCTQYCWGNRADVEHLKFALETLADLIDIGYSMLESWPDEAELRREDWTPPRGSEVHP